MKKIRIFACLAALLLCFQTGISMTANASEEIQETTENITVSETELKEACQNIKNYLKFSQRCGYYEVSYDVQNSSVLVQVQAEIFRKRVESYFQYCQNNSSVKHISLVTELLNPADYAEPDTKLEEISDILNAYIIENVLDAVSCQVIYQENDNYLLVALMEDSYRAESQLQQIQNYYQELGLNSNLSFEKENLYWKQSAASMNFSQAAAVKLKYHLRKIALLYQENSDIILIQKTEDSPEAEENFRLMQEYCEAEGLSGKVAFSDEILIDEDTEQNTIDTVIMAGDVTLNNKIDILDVIVLNKAIIGREKLNAVQELAADANNDDKIDAADALIIMKMIVGLTISS